MGAPRKSEHKMLEDKAPHSEFHQILERLVDEHDREVTLLRTENVELRTQLNVLDPTQTYDSCGDRKEEGIMEKIKEWAAERRMAALSTQAEVEEEEDQEEDQEEEHEGEDKAVCEKPEKPQRSTARQTSAQVRFSDSIGSEGDWPPVPVNTAHGEAIWSSIDPSNDDEDGTNVEDNNSSSNNRGSVSSGIKVNSSSTDGRPRQVCFAAVPDKWDNLVSSGSVMETQQRFAELSLRIRRDFEDACGQSHESGMVLSCFKVWALLARHMNSRFSFPVLDPWSGDGPISNSAGGLTLDHNASMHMRSMDSDHPIEEEGVELDNPPTEVQGRFILAPNASARMWWDLAGTFLLIYDIIGIPLDAFDPDPHPFTTFMDYMTLVFWTLDIVMSCMTGYVHRGVTIMDPKLIMRNYLKTLFVMDLIVVGPDWVFLFVRMSSPEGTSSTSGQGGNRLVRIMRVVRLARLLRLVKLARGVAMIRDRIESEVMFIVANILKLIVMLLIVNHFLGSLWYFVGTLGKNEGEANWIQAHRFEEEDLGYRYFTALHWSLTQFTPASMDVQPHNILERVVAIFCLVFGLVLFSSFISSITASMTQLRNMSEDKSKQFWLLRRYLRQRGIDKQLTFRILRYVEYAIKEKTVQVSESKVWSLSLLSHRLREELQYEVSFKCLMSHPFFEKAREVSSMSTFQLAEQALSVEMLATADTLFNPGTAATQMFIVAYGQLRYLKMDELYLREMQDCESRLGKDDWACEQALWTKWTHLGSLRAASEVRLVAIDAKKFQDVINTDPVAWELARTYAEQYVEWLNETPRGVLSDVSHKTSMVRMVRQFLVGGKRMQKLKSVRALGLLDLDDEGDEEPLERTPDLRIPDSRPSFKITAKDSIPPSARSEETSVFSF